MKKFIIADDHALFRETLEEYLRRHFPQAESHFVVNFYQAYSLLEAGENPDLMILDYHMAGMDKGQGLLRIKKSFPDIKVALMSGMAEAEEVRYLLDNGAVGYFPKTLSGAEYISGIQQILAGETFVPVNAETGVILKTHVSGDSGASAHGDFITSTDVNLSRREGQVLKALLKGLSNKEIANDFGLQEVTVKMHISNICHKLDVKNRTQAALKARELGFREG